VEDCKRPPKKEKEVAQPEANVVIGAANHSGVMMLATWDIERVSSQIHLTVKVTPMLVPDGVWVLDTGASNHMTGNRSVLSRLDEGVRGLVRFGDGSHVSNQGKGSVVIQDHAKGHKVLTNVYFIPKLKSNIVSLGQLEEKGFKYVGENGKLCVYDQERTLLISTPRVGNRLYLAKFGLDSPVCL